MNSRAKLLKVGWDTPTTGELVQWSEDVSRSPFDGVTVLLEAKTPAGAVTGKLSIDGWSVKKFVTGELDEALEDLDRTNLDLSHSFVRFNCGPGDIDWFGDFSSVINNLVIAAKVARAAGMRGIWLDTETYNRHIWDLSTRPQAATKGWAGYQAQVRQRGKEIMEALLSIYPDIVLFLALGNSWVVTNRGSVAWGGYRYDLLVPFADGLLAAQPGVSQILDGNERTYGWKTGLDMARAWEDGHARASTLAADPTLYRYKIAVGLSLWLDYNQPTLGWNIGDPEANYFSPGVFERTLRAALRLADGYVWIYTHRPRWWGPNGPDDLPQAYDTAIRSAKGLPPR